MNQVTCPYLGLRDDPKTVLDFPSEGNFCHRARPVAPVSRSHQQDFCLCPEHINCPVFRRTEEAPLPDELISPVHLQFQKQKVIYGSAFLMLAAIILIVLMIFWKNTRSVDGAGVGQFTETNELAEGTSALVFNPIPVNLETGTIALTPLTPAAATILASSSGTPCDTPAGWIVYSVKPTDSIFRLSLVFGVSVADLQKGNCLGEETVIRPGQQIYVPNPPTSTPTSTLTPTQTRRPNITATLKPTRTPRRPVGAPSQPTFDPGSIETSPPPSRPTSAPAPTAQPPEPSSPESTGQVIIPTAVTPTRTPIPPAPTRTPISPSPTLRSPTSTNTPAPPTQTPVTPSPIPIPSTSTPFPPSPTPDQLIPTESETRFPPIPTHKWKTPTLVPEPS